MPGAVAFVSDLMFTSRIREAARASGVELRTARDAATLLTACRTELPAVVLIDLDDARLAPLQAVGALRSDAALAELPVVGFISHVNGLGATAAKQAGCTRVLARSAFVAELPRILAGDI